MAKKFKPGLYRDVPNEAYHNGPGVSKSGLWTISEKSPAHFKFPAPREEMTTQTQYNFDVGTATHTAILEPHNLEKTIVRGPGDKRGNKWSDLKAAADAANQILLVDRDYDAMLAMRDAVHANAQLNAIITGGKDEDRIIEGSAYWYDEATGVLCRCRPDLYRRDLKIVIDLKTSVTAAPDEFARAVTRFGYHAQEAFYSDGMNQIGEAVEGFAFVVLEKSQGTPVFKSPYASAVYELPPSIVEDGRLIMRQALDRFAECVKTDKWPSYGDGIQELEIKRWAYRYVDPSIDEEDPE